MPAWLIAAVAESVLLGCPPQDPGAEQERPEASVPFGPAPVVDGDLEEWPGLEPLPGRNVLSRERVDVEMAAHGHSVIEIRRIGGRWSVVTA